MKKALWIVSFIPLVVTAVLLQYLPVSWLLCRCYERCNSIWGSIFFHMLVNGVAVSTISFLQEMM